MIRNNSVGEGGDWRMCGGWEEEETCGDRKRRERRGLEGKRAMREENNEVLGRRENEYE